MLSPFIRNIESTIARYRMLEPDDRVLVGVSGGADSVSLLLALRELGYTVAVAHLNHGLRGAASDEDEQFVRRLAQDCDVQFFSRQIAFGEQDSGNIEANGREARRKFFDQTLAESHFDKIALAHTRGDRVETFLINLLRGSGMGGLVSMAPTVGRTVRPLIERDRSEVESYLQSRNQSWRTDDSNMDVALTRNRMRHVTIPELTQIFNSQLAVTLSRTIEVLQDEDQLMRDMAEDWLRKHATVSGNELKLDAVFLSGEPRGLIRRVIRTALKQVGSSLRDVTFDHVEHVRGLLEEAKSGKTIELPGEVVVCREFGCLTFRERLEAAQEFSYDLRIPGEIHIDEIGRTFRAEIVDHEKISPDDPRVFVDGGRLGPYVRIRNWKPGDFYSPVGLPSGKLKKLFQRARIPRSQRSRWPVFVTGPAVVWVASFPVSREFAACSRSQKVVALEALPG